jgi:DNA recombination protein RmuC
MDAVALLIGLAVGLVAGGVIGALVVRLRGARGAVDSDPAVLAARHAASLAELRSELGSQLAAAQASVGGLREQLAATQEQYRETMERARAESAAESKVLQALTPVQESLRTMQNKVTELETQRNLQHGELSQQLKAAAESEERLRATAESL